MKERNHDKQQYYWERYANSRNLIYNEKMKSLVRGKKDLHREKLIKHTLACVCY
jgi:hypothetical protein